MNVLDLSRFQFGMTTIFHFFFVPLSIGLGVTVAIMETLYVIKKDDKYKDMAQFWGRIFLLSFAVGIVTGLIQEFQFGMNWSDYSRFVGDIFGAPLAVEALLAFFMESTFLGLWMFTWGKVKKGLHLLFIWLVSLGSILSAFWILTANSFMQHPVGYALKNGRAEMVDFKALLTNPQLWYEFSHVIFGALITGGIAVASLAAFKMLKKQVDKHKNFYHSTIKVGLILTLIGSVGTLASGDVQMQYLLKEQPMKFSAMEGVYDKTSSPAPWAVLAWANEKEHKNDFEVNIPGLLSVLSYHKLSGSVDGMNDINKRMQAQYGKDNNYYPPVNVLFYSFRLMAGFAAVFLGISLLGLWLLRNKNGEPRLFKHKWMLWILGIMIIAPFLVNTAGWVITEEGRQPFSVYGLLTEAQSVSQNTTVASLLTSNIVYFILFAGLSIVMIYLVCKEMKKGPYYEEKNQEALDDPFVEGGE